MNCKVQLNGKNNELVEFDINLKQLEDGDTSELYDTLCGLFPENTWEDICCDSIEYHDNYVMCFVSVY